MVAFAVLYPMLGGLRHTTLDETPVYSIQCFCDTALDAAGTILTQSLYFSVMTFTTLGTGNLEPVSVLVRYLAIIESALGAILLALFVAVLTRSTWLP